MPFISDLSTFETKAKWQVNIYCPVALGAFISTAVGISDASVTVDDVNVNADSSLCHSSPPPYILASTSFSFWDVHHDSIQ